MGEIADYLSSHDGKLSYELLLTDEEANYLIRILLKEFLSISDVKKDFEFIFGDDPAIESIIKKGKRQQIILSCCIDDLQNYEEDTPKWLKQLKKLKEGLL